MVKARFVFFVVHLQLVARQIARFAAFAPKHNQRRVGKLLSLLHAFRRIPTFVGFGQFVVVPPLPFIVPIVVVRRCQILVYPNARLAQTLVQRHDAFVSTAAATCALMYKTVVVACVTEDVYLALAVLVWQKGQSVVLVFQQRHTVGGDFHTQLGVVFGGFLALLRVGNNARSAQRKGDNTAESV